MQNQDENYFYEYWIGKDVNLQKTWDAYHNGKGYEQKFASMSCHVIEITFEKTSREFPIFNLEPIFKTTKAYYHNLKRDCLPEQEYNSAGPLFIYEINRGSGIWTWLGELYYVLLLGTTLTEEKIKGQRIDNIEKKLKILKEYFGDSNVRPELFQAFMEANTPDDMEQAMQHLFNERIQSIKISRSPVITNIEDARKEMIDIGEVLKKLRH